MVGVTGRDARIPGKASARSNHHFFRWQVIAPEEIVDPNVDEHSVMTYLSQFPKAKLKPGAPVRSKQLNPKKAIAYGPGMWASLWPPQVVSRWRLCE